MLEMEKGNFIFDENVKMPENFDCLETPYIFGMKQEKKDMIPGFD